MEINKANTFLSQFNETIEKWIVYLDDYTLEMLCRRPQIESWSLGQVYIHIIGDTKYYIEQIKASLSDNMNSEKEMHEDAKAIFRNNGFPDIPLENPSNDLNLRQPQSKDELLQGLASIKDEINKLYFMFDFEKSSGKTEHPGFRFFNALEWLQLAEMHMRHHFRQKKRIDDILFLDKTGERQR
jgi:hypothetical protein